MFRDDQKDGMTKYPARLILVSGILLGLLPQAGAGHFRDCDFGTSLEKISVSEKAQFLQVTSSAVIYQDVLFGFETQVVYHLSADDTLAAGAYHINAVGCEIEEILDHYMEVVEALDNRYGPSPKDGIIWWSENSIYRDDIVNAFRFGEASFRKEWYGPGVHIILTLNNELNTEGAIRYRIVYEPGREYNREQDLVKL